MKILRICLFFIFCLNLYANESFTKEEQEWIKNNPIIKVGVDANWPPFDFVNEQNTHKGIASDYLKLIASKTGLNFEVYSSSWSNVIKKMKNKELDILACAAKTAQRESYLSFTKSYINVDVAVVTRDDFFLESFDEIKDYRIALPQDNFVYEELKKRYPKAEFIFVKSNEEALDYVSFQKADIYVGNLPVISYFTQKNLLTNLQILFKAPFDKTKLSLAVDKDKKILLSVLDKSLSLITQKERELIQKKWIESKYTKKNKNIETLLTKEEKLWLKKHGKIKIAGDPYWPPYSYYNEHDMLRGIVADYLEEIFKESSLDIEYVKTDSWSQTLDFMEKEQIDMIDAISFSNQRSNFLNFSSKYLGAEIVLISNNRNDKYVDSFKSIADMKLGTVQGYSIIEKIENEHPYVQNLKLFRNPLDGLKALSSSQIDYFILDIPSFEYYSKTYGISNLKIVGPTGYNYKYGFGISKKHPELLSIMNKLLESLSQDKKDLIYRKWIKVDYTKEIDYDLIIKIIALALMIIVGTVYWNRKLQKEIEDRKKIQKQLEESKNFITSIMDSQVDIVITTTGNTIKQANKAFFEFTGYKTIKAFKKDFNCICEMFDTSNPSKFLIKEKNGVSWIDEVLVNPNKIYKALIYKNSKAHIFKISASYIVKANDLKTAVLTDITKLEDLNEVLLKAKNEALNVAKQKSEFLANMSHEIRTPMNSVIGFTELLDKEIVNPIQKDYLNSIKKGGNALLRIINDILDLSKIEAGKLEIQTESINPSSLFTEIESIFHSKIVSKNVNFIIEVDKSIPEFIILDGVRVRQILFNLIGNAIKFTEKGHIKLKVENHYKDNIKSKIDLTFIIEDSGIGIEKKNLENIFRAFEQQKDQNTAKYGGTGLGLAICSKLVHMMNGKIEVESKKNEGSTFKVTLHDIDVSSIGEKIEANKLNFENIVFEKSTILVVDDVDENRKLVQASLKDFDFNLIMAQNGQEAIERLQNINVDLILMDLRMPIMDGYKAATLIKEDEELKEIPLIALTASVMGKDLEKVSRYGFDAYLRKPVILDDLVETISRFISYDFKDSAVEKNINESSNISEESLTLLLESLNGKVKDKWNEVKDKGDIFLIEEFVKELENNSLDINITLLKNYIEELKIHIDSFDIEKVDYLMNTYLELINKIEKLR